MTPATPNHPKPHRGALTEDIEAPRPPGDQSWRAPRRLFEMIYGGGLLMEVVRHGSGPPAWDTSVAYALAEVRKPWLDGAAGGVHILCGSWDQPA